MRRDSRPSPDCQGDPWCTKGHTPLRLRQDLHFLGGNTIVSLSLSFFVVHRQELHEEEDGCRPRSQFFPQAETEKFSSKRKTRQASHGPHFSVDVQKHSKPRRRQSLFLKRFPGQSERKHRQRCTSEGPNRSLNLTVASVCRLGQCSAASVCSLPPSGPLSFPVAGQEPHKLSCLSQSSLPQNRKPHSADCKPRSHSELRAQAGWGEICRGI